MLSVSTEFFRSLLVDCFSIFLAGADRLPNGYHVIQLKHLICFYDRSGFMIGSV